MHIEYSADGKLTVFFALHNAHGKLHFKLHYLLGVCVCVINWNVNLELGWGTGPQNVEQREP